VDTLVKNARGTHRNQCTRPKDTDFRMRTWVRMRTETTRKHVWRKVSASQSRAAEPTLKAAVLAAAPDEESAHWLNASQTSMDTATTSQSASHT